MFATINFQCETDGCPNAALGQMHAMVKLTETGNLPWLVCGVCEIDIIPNPESSND